MSTAMLREEKAVSDTIVPAARPWFTVGGHSYDRGDVVLAAILRGDWQKLEVELRQGLACVRRSRETGTEPGSSEMERVAEEFRYARNLISADETEEWLARCGLDFEGWTDYLERTLLRCRWANQIHDVVAAHPVGEDELGDSLAAEAICSGELQNFAETLAGRAAVCERASGEVAAHARVLDHVELRREHLRTLGRSGLLEASVPAAEWKARLVALARMEATFQACLASAVTPEAVRREIAAHRVDWIQVRWRCLVLRDEPTAREAAWCLRRDAEPLEDVARRSGAELREEERLLESLDEAIRAAALSARPNDWLGPWSAGEGFRLARLIGKAHPSEDAPSVKRRAEEEIPARLVAEAMKRVRWHQGI